MDAFFDDQIGCTCGGVLSMQDLIGFREGIFNVQCPQCGREIEVYANLEVSYTIMPKMPEFTVQSILDSVPQE